MLSSARWTSGKRAHHLVRVLECWIRRLPARRRPQFNLCDHSAFIAEMIASALLQSDRISKRLIELSCFALLRQGSAASSL